MEEGDRCENGFPFDTRQGPSPARHHLGRAELPPGAIPLLLPSSHSQYLHFHQPCPPHCSLHEYQYLLQKEIFTEFLPLLALYKGTHISFGVFEKNNTHKHLPVTGHKNTHQRGQRGTEDNNETPRQRQEGGGSRGLARGVLVKVPPHLKPRFLSPPQ